MRLNEELSYMAGVFDGEGCIGIYAFGTRKANKQYQYYTLQLQLKICNEYIPKLFQFHFGGKVREVKREKEGWKPIWTWVASSKDAKTTLEALVPKLRLKKAEAELALRFETEKEAHLYKRGLTEEELAIQEVQSILMKNLKQEVKKQ